MNATTPGRRRGIPPVPYHHHPDFDRRIMFIIALFVQYFLTRFFSSPVARPPGKCSSDGDGSSSNACHGSHGRGREVRGTAPDAVRAEGRCCFRNHQSTKVSNEELPEEGSTKISGPPRFPTQNLFGFTSKLGNLTCTLQTCTAWAASFTAHGKSELE